MEGEDRGSVETCAEKVSGVKTCGFIERMALVAGKRTRLLSDEIAIDDFSDAGVLHDCGRVESQGFAEGRTSFQNEVSFNWLKSECHLAPALSLTR